MSRRAFEEKAGLYDSMVSVRDDHDHASERTLEGLPDPEMILFETGQALAAALAVSLVVYTLLQWAGIR